MGTKVTRKELYELVWKRPVTLLSKKYSYSDVGFAKVCRRLRVPLPPRGYWARKSSQRVRRPPLPKPVKGLPLFHVFPTDINDQFSSESPNLEGQSKNVCVNDADKCTQEFFSEDQQEINEAEEIIKNIKSAARSIKVARSFRDIDAKVTEVKKALSLANPNRYGVIQLSKNNYFLVRVSPTLAQRAVLLLNAIVKYVQVFGGKIVSSHYNNIHGILFFEERVDFSIEETANRSDYLSSQKESITYPKYIYNPSGKLTLKIDFRLRGRHGLRKTWTDKTDRSVETFLPDFLIEVVKAAAALSIIRKADLKEEKLRAIKRQEIRELEEQRKQKVEQQKLLEEMAQCFDKSQQIRKFVANIESFSTKGLSGEPPTELVLWLKWAKEYADGIDPTSTVIDTFNKK